MDTEVVVTAAIADSNYWISGTAQFMVCLKANPEQRYEFLVGDKNVVVGIFIPSCEFSGKKVGDTFIGNLVFFRAVLGELSPFPATCSHGILIVGACSAFSTGYIAFQCGFGEDELYLGIVENPGRRGVAHKHGIVGIALRRHPPGVRRI